MLSLAFCLVFLLPLSTWLRRFLNYQWAHQFNKLEDLALVRDNSFILPINPPVVILPAESDNDAEPDIHNLSVLPVPKVSHRSVTVRKFISALGATSIQPGPEKKQRETATSIY